MTGNDDSLRILDLFDMESGEAWLKDSKKKRKREHGKS
jgi:hypothetical protein